MNSPYDRSRVETIVEKAEFMETCLDVLVQKQSIGWKDYETDLETRDIVERRFEKLTGAALDIGRILLKDIDGAAPDSNAAVMNRLAAAGILSDDVGEAMAEAALFRNVLAHEYGNVLDHRTVYEALQDLERYRLFLHDVRDHLKDVGAL